MKKNVIISIRSKQTMDGKEADPIELVTEGSLTSRSTGGYLLSYEETELTGLEGTRTTFRVEPQKVSLIRTGAVCSQMVFEVGRKHTSLYQTPFGNMEVGISTKQINNGLNDRGGDLEVDYAVEIDHALAGRNLFSIQVKEAARS
jgi:uncharacterized beta-barrel protein YwiB (DUF1934 family)